MAISILTKFSILVLEYTIIHDQALCVVQYCTLHIEWDMINDHGDSVPFDFEPNGISFRSKSKGTLSP